MNYVISDYVISIVDCSIESISLQTCVEKGSSLTAIGKRAQTGSFHAYHWKSDGYREGDGYRVPAGYRVRHTLAKKKKKHATSVVFKDTACTLLLRTNYESIKRTLGICWRRDGREKIDTLHWYPSFRNVFVSLSQPFPETCHCIMHCAFVDIYRSIEIRAWHFVKLTASTFLTLSYWRGGWVKKKTEGFSFHTLLTVTDGP